MPVERTHIEGLLVVRWDTYADDRGFFRQTYQRREIDDLLGREISLVQGNHSRSAPGVLRGFHAEPWDKLVYAVSGNVLAVIADIRPDSATFGQTATFQLGDPPGERLRLFIAQGLANSFMTTGETVADYVYDVGDYYRPGVPKRAVAWDDPDLGVTWPLDQPLLSPDDQRNPTLRELHPDHPRWSA
jgi:dTDP-4-dehydrorhamnose 3,5-epimerase